MLYNASLVCEGGAMMGVYTADCKTGKPVYIKCFAKDKQVIHASRASSSMPFLSPIYNFDGIECLDGGISKSIPIERAISYGNDKIVVVLTKPLGYRKQPVSAFKKHLINRVYGDYPELEKTMLNRYIDYNKDTELVDKLEKDGKIFVFRPESHVVSRHESNYDKLRKGYDVGAADAENRLEELLDYLNQ